MRIGGRVVSWPACYAAVGGLAVLRHTGCLRSRARQPSAIELLIDRTALRSDLSYLERTQPNRYTQGGKHGCSTKKRKKAFDFHHEHLSADDRRRCIIHAVCFGI